MGLPGKGKRIRVVRDPTPSKPLKVPEPTPEPVRAPDREPVKA